MPGLTMANTRQQIQLNTPGFQLLQKSSEHRIQGSALKKEATMNRPKIYPIPGSILLFSIIALFLPIHLFAPQITPFFPSFSFCVKVFV